MSAFVYGYVTYTVDKCAHMREPHLTKIDRGRARDSEFMPRKYLPRSHRGYGPLDFSNTTGHL